MQIRAATAADAHAACVVLRRSIAELCERDHHGDPAVLDAWLANKTVANVGQWIADTNNRVFVAADGDNLLAVGAVNAHGEITLNYVSPDARFGGVSRAMLACLEKVARHLGNDICSLVSTETALQFYRSAGYELRGTPEGRFGTTSSYPMAKRLGAPRPLPGLA